MQTYTLDNSAVAEWKKFPNGELYVRVQDVKEKVAVVGRTYPPGDNLVATLLLIDTLKRNGAKEITLLLPYFAYGRQDRGERAGECVSALFVAQQLAAAGATRIVTADIHSQRIVEASPIPIENVDMSEIFAGELRSSLGEKDFTVVSPDEGGKDRAQLLAKALGAENFAWMEKERSKNGAAKAMALHGKLVGEKAVIVDDMVDTGGTLAEAVHMLRDRRVEEIIVCATHPIFSGAAAERVAALNIKKIIVTDTLPIPPPAASLKNLTIIPVAETLVAQLRREWGGREQSR